MEKICKTQQQQTEAKVADDQHQEEHIFVVSCLATNKFTENWLINNNCTNHMTHDGKLFTELDRNVISKVKIGNGTHLKVEGKGTVTIETHSRFKLISNVLYVYEIHQNLLSVSQLLDIGYKVLFEDKSCVIEDVEGIKFFNIQMKGKSFVLDFKEELVVVHKEVNNSMLWHKRMGHYCYEALFFMEKNNMVKGLPKLGKDFPICAACQYGKLSRLPFQQSKAWRSTQKLQLIHIDVGGPMNPSSLNGNKYYVSFIDDYS